MQQSDGSQKRWIITQQTKPPLHLRHGWFPMNTIHVARISVSCAAPQPLRAGL
jgi:hypothetical protein